MLCMNIEKCTMHFRCISNEDDDDGDGDGDDEQEESC